jgi:hypothetical protein
MAKCIFCGSGIHWTQELTNKFKPSQGIIDEFCPACAHDLFGSSIFNPLPLPALVTDHRPLTTREGVPA